MKGRDEAGRGEIQRAGETRAWGEHSLFGEPELVEGLLRVKRVRGALLGAFPDAIHSCPPSSL